ncbi:endonuclease domain-containing protein [Pontixanthobacter sp.]|uniref:endonuclease domain-containing protein n=1 Tax=Pontixanthobacter sp. TaxID=2792078 RepID=UPI003C7EBA34
MRNAASLQHAKTMRKEPTEPEKRLWHQLRAGRFRGIKFRRQKVVGKYIVDFASNAPKLVIELDGDTHAFQAEYDAERTAFLNGEGYRVLRFCSNDVMRNMDGVLVRIGEAVDELKGSPPLPTLSPEGETALACVPPLPLRGEDRGEGPAA